jgi:DNA-binding IclR family transcriptional regulator
LKFLSKSILVSENLDLKEIGHPYLKTITEKYQETSNLCLYQHEEIYCIDQVESPRGYLVVSSKIGYGLPMHATASGKLVLANLPADELKKFLSKYNPEKLTDKTITDIQKVTASFEMIRNQGFAIEEEEVQLGAYSIAAPIKNHNSRVLGTISISGPVSRIKGCEKQIREDLIESANAISNDLGYHGKKY